MSESAKPRFAVDLDDIEKQLAFRQAAPAQPASATKSDPLAELARIVGQEDPFQSLLSAGNAPQSGRSAPNLDELFAPQESVAAAPRSFREPELRAGIEMPAAFDLDQYQPAPAAARSYAAPQDAPHAGSPDQAYRQDGYDRNYYAAPTAGQTYAEDEIDEESVRPLPRHGSRKGMIAIGAVLCAALVGGGGAWYFSGSTATGGKPPLIRASKEPTKVQPENPGGVEIPNQNKQIYERAAQPTETKVVTREEQPVDVKQATRVATADATGAAVPAASASGQNNALSLGEPRKVRTVSIRPDGSVANQEAAPAAARPVSLPPAAATPPATQPTAQPKPVAATPAAMPPAAQPAVQPKPTAAAPAPSAAASAASAGKPTPTIGSLAQASNPAAAPAPKPETASTTPQPQKVAAVAAPAAAAPEADAETAAEIAPSAGGAFSVQLGVRSSEADAQAAFRQFQKKYEDLDGVAPMIRKAESNGNVIYRVRTSGMSREEASALCSKLQGQGGQCFVAKN